MALDFHREIFSSLLDDDGILVMAQGLGLHKILLNFLKLHCDSSSLVFVLGVSKVEQATISEELRIADLPKVPKSVPTESTVTDRYFL